MCSSEPTGQRALVLWVSHVMARCLVPLQKEWGGGIETRSLCRPLGPTLDVSFPSEGTGWEACLTHPKSPVGDSRLQFAVPNLQTVIKTNGTRHIESAP